MSADRVIRIATRKSPLALCQTQIVVDLLQEQPFSSSVTSVLHPLSTTGDEWLAQSLSTVGGKGLFVKELEEALLNNQADLAVHSMKDMPVTPPPGLVIGAVLKRETPADVLICHLNFSLETLKPGAVLGTSSLRRQAQILNLRPDLRMQLLRGNVNSRLEKLENGLYDGIILAQAGLKRLQISPSYQQDLSQLILPAAGQGALALECRSDDKSLLEWLKPLNDPVTAACVSAERRVTEILEAGCQAPIAALACPSTDHPGSLFLEALVAQADGQRIIRSSKTGQSPEALGRAVAEELIKQGAWDLLKFI